MLGLVGLLTLQSQRLGDYFKESIMVEIFLKEQAKTVDIQKFQKSMDASGVTLRTQYVDKDEAARIYKEQVGEDFTSFLDTNPLPHSVQVYLKASYTNPDSLRVLEANWAKNSLVKEVNYERNLVDKVSKNTRTFGLIILGFTVLMMAIAIALINNSIRMAVYSKRFLINSMRLVGATPAFIRRPFIWKGLLNGFLAALIAIGFLALVIYLAQTEWPDLKRFYDRELYIMLFGGVIALGILISWISTTLAVRKFLRIKSDRLYY